MAGVMTPQKKPGLTDTLVTGGLQALGGSFGGPVGAMAGAELGNQLTKDKDSQGVQSAMQRRSMAIAGGAAAPAMAEDPAASIGAANQALAQLPPSYQKRYGPDLTEAMRRAQAQQGVA